MHATAEILDIGRIGGGGAGLLGIGPGLLVGVLARLLIRPLLLLLCLLRVRGLAASRREGSRGNDCNDRQFRKCDTSSVLGLLTPITAHAWPFCGFYTRASVPSTPTRIAGSICPETAEWSKDGRPRLVPDKIYPGMWRVVGPSGTLSDMVNKTRAQDVAWRLAQSMVSTRTLAA